MVLQLLCHSHSQQISVKPHKCLSLWKSCTEKTQGLQFADPFKCGKSEHAEVTDYCREASLGDSLLMHKSLVPVKKKANGSQHKIAFLANGSSLNNVKWVCNDFETRPGAIDRLSQWKGSYCFDREQTAFHCKCDWACGVSGFISEHCINRHLIVVLFLFYMYLPI